jgi:DNA polymerase (family 10)
MADRRIESNQDVADLLRDVRAAYQMKGVNRFEAQAYDNAAAGAEHATQNLRELYEQDRLQEVPGVGPRIADYLAELYLTGRVKHFDEVFAGIPDVVFDLIKIPGVGPATAQKLAAAGVEDLKDLELKLGNAELFSKGISKKVQENIGTGLAELQRRSGRLMLPKAAELAKELLDYLRTSPAVIEAVGAGSLRRRLATIGDVDIIVSTREPGAVIRYFLSFPGVHSVIDSGETAASVLLHNGIHSDVLTGPPESYGALLHHFTGSKHHNIHIRRLARETGYSVSEHGVKRLSDGETLRMATEDDLYKLLGMQTPPPEIREDTGEIEAALAGKLPALVERKDIRGDCHTHTAWSDGRDSMAEMAAACRALGREYMVITDHSYPNLDFVTRSRELDALRESDPGIRLMDGLEVNITSEGGLQVPDEVLAAHEYCIASIHSSFRQPRDVMTRRILAALEHPSINGIAHPTGRLINAREGVEADWDAVMSACLRLEKFLEIDGYPDRLDLPDNLVRAAVRRGVKMVIDSDAHATEQLEMLVYGVDDARRGWATAANILNTLPYDDFVREAHVRLRLRR